jgi:hypothetical protein
LPIEDDALNQRRVVSARLRLDWILTADGVDDFISPFGQCRGKGSGVEVIGGGVKGQGAEASAIGTFQIGFRLMTSFSRSYPKASVAGTF